MLRCLVILMYIPPAGGFAFDNPIHASINAALSRFDEDAPPVVSPASLPRQTLEPSSEAAASAVTRPPPGPPSRPVALSPIVYVLLFGVILFKPMWVAEGRSGKYGCRSERPHCSFLVLGSSVPHCVRAVVWGSYCRLQTVWVAEGRFGMYGCRPERPRCSVLVLGGGRGGCGQDSAGCYLLVPLCASRYVLFVFLVGQVPIRSCCGCRSSQHLPCRCVTSRFCVWCVVWPDRGGCL